MILISRLLTLCQLSAFVFSIFLEINKDHPKNVGIAWHEQQHNIALTGHNSAIAAADPRTKGCRKVFQQWPAQLWGGYQTTALDRTIDQDHQYSSIQV